MVTLTKGMTGPDIVVLQLLLKAGWYNSDGIKCDGVYGDNTDTGVKELQSAAKIEQTGNFGDAEKTELLAIDGLSFDEIMAALGIAQRTEEAPQVAAAAAENVEVVVDESTGGLVAGKGV